MLAHTDTWAVATAELGRRGFTVNDDLLTDEQRDAIDQTLQGGWTYGWKSDVNDHYAFWHRHFAGNLNPDNTHAGRGQAKYDCAAELQRTVPGIYALWFGLQHTLLTGHTLVRCYANGGPYGAEGSIHTDSAASNSYTTIYYPHAEWHPNWGGETVLFNADRTDITAAIYPRPGRLFTFRGTIPHVGRGVSRVCPKLRVTLMFKTELDPAA